MLANRVREYTVTTGTGDITLGGAIAGHIRFADAFEPGDSVIYVIEDRDNYEIGTGTLIDANTLARTTVSEVLVDGILTRENPGAISLSGQARLYSAVTAEFLLTGDVVTGRISEAETGSGIRVDGDAQFSSDVSIGGTLSKGISNSTLAISGGTDGSTGGNVVFNGEGAANPRDIRFRDGITPVLTYGATAGEWNFQGAGIKGVGDVVLGGSVLVGNGSYGVSGGAGIEIDQGAGNVATLRLEGTSAVEFRADLGAITTDIRSGHDYVISHTGTEIARFGYADRSTTFSGKMYQYNGDPVFELAGTNLGGIHSNQLNFKNATGTQMFRIHQSYIGGPAHAYIDVNNPTASLILQTQGVDAVSIDDNQKTTFLGQVTINRSGDNLLRIEGGIANAKGLTFVGGTNQAQAYLVDHTFKILTGTTSSVAEALAIDSNQNAAFSGDIKIDNATPRMSWWVSGLERGWITAGAGGTILYNAIGDHRLSINGVEGYRLKNDLSSVFAGDVGIGTSPSGDLHIKAPAGNNAELYLEATTFTPVMSLYSGGPGIQPIIKYGTGTGATKLRFQKIATGTGVDAVGTDVLTLNDDFSATFAGDVEVNGTLQATGGTPRPFKLANTVGATTWMELETVAGDYFIGYGSQGFMLSPDTTVVDFSIDSSQNATFAGDVGIVKPAGTDGHFTVTRGATDVYTLDAVFDGANINAYQVLRLGTGGQHDLVIDAAHNATFAGDVALHGNITVPSGDTLFVGAGTTTGATNSANVLFYGENSGSPAGDMSFRHGNTIWAYYDKSLNDLTFNSKVIASSKLTVNGGAKISVQNQVDGGSGQGIFFWDTDTPQWGLYLAQAGAGKALDDDTACTSLDGRTGFHVRNRADETSTSGFLWETNNEKCLMSLTGDTGDLYVRGSYYGESGSAAIPTYSFTSDPDTGIYRSAPNAIGFTTGGGARMTISTSDISSGLVIRLPDGTSALPAYSFNSDPDTGMYHSAADRVALATGGNRRFEVGESTAAGNAGVWVPGGSGVSLVVGSDINGLALTDLTQKVSRIGSPHYTLAEEALAVISGDSNSTYSNVNVGGGSSLTNAATGIQFYTATNNTTVTGSRRWYIDNVGDLIADQASVIRRISTDSAMIISGGDAGNDGGNILVYGSAHATQANDIALRSGNSYRLQWDQDANQWNFHNNVLNFVANIYRGSTDGGLRIGGGNTPNNGGEIIMYGGANASKASDIEFYSDGALRAAWDHSDSVWDFNGSNIRYIHNIVFSSSGGDLVKSTTTGDMQISGGSSVNLGANVIMHGESHATNANDIRFRKNADDILTYDSSAYLWNFRGNDVTGVGKLTVDGGAKISVQNQTDGGSGHGIFLWDTVNTNYGIYVASSGANRSLNDGTTCASLSGQTALHTRFRNWSGASQGWIWENHFEQCLMSLTSDTGDLYTKGNIVVGGANISRIVDTSAMVVSGGDSDVSGGNIVLFGGTHSTLANDILLRTGTTNRLHWDASEGHWDFHNYNLHRVGDLDVSGKLSLGSPTELTIVSGAITVTKAFHTVDTEADAATDNLDTINGYAGGEILILRAHDGARTVVLKDGTGNLRLAGDFALDSSDNTITLVFDGTVWREISRSNNA